MTLLVWTWTFILAIAVAFYVLLDGFDLGVGILFGVAPAEHRPVMMNSISPTWDGNETWLVLGGIGLLAAFPLAFAIIIPAVYIPLLIMLLALVFRGVAFEFRFHEPWLRRFWDRAFCIGSAVATFAQGLVLGSFIQGYKVEGRAFAGGPFDWLTPFSLTIGVALMFGYALLGAGWLIIKTEGALQDWARRAARICLIAVVVAIAVVSLWTPLAYEAIRARWFSWPNIVLFSPVPVIVVALAWIEWRALRNGRELTPFACSIGLFLMSFLGLAISLWPMVVPPRYTLSDAASSASTQSFLLIGTLILLPIILFYTGWSYWVFRGKVRADAGYH
ncbi:MAG TPA: cytochrome d ubiquinol oxidase subunit II [Micropepsaceae bacterium]|jgi:cytochrome d ubiquinol oxidase subunit II|nr:cytochrome d ubiquinol oxidase subunit II [Micropepsaceae bacterium]